MDEETLFHRALERPAGERDAFLEQACPGDPGLRRRVRTLLQAHEQPATFLRPPAGEGPAFEPRLSLAPGTVVGRYKILEPIGEGGYGAVFMAEQTAPVQRRVALKVLKAGMDTRQVIARFEAERQALALMDHPNIAKVFDAGVTDGGRPFFVMELVKGRPITADCDEHKLNPRQRLGLFVHVCNAVQHAHQKGIIHRDIKPTNVLVAQYDGEPVPKVIDFGVAKATGQRLTDATMFTGFGDVIGTPQYMSPEQAELNQLDVDTRSDIYSLGVLLYELLTGTTPLEAKRVKAAALLEVLRVIREEEPPRPSTRLTATAELPSIAAQRGLEPKSLSGIVRGELDWIVMKALEKDRGRRYETASGFARDVERYLHDEPVIAGPTSATYRLRKFVRRNRASVLTGAIALLVLVVLGTAAGWAVRDRSARRAKVGGQVELILNEVDELERERKWSEALTAARRAEAAVAGGEADARTTESVRDRLKALKLIQDLEQARMAAASGVVGSFDNAGADRAYAAAFRAYGVDVIELPLETAIDLLGARPALAVPLAAALDDWAKVRRRLEPEAVSSKRLWAVARGIDPEPLRDRVRALRGQPAPEVVDELCRLAERIDPATVHPATLSTLSGELVRVQRPDHAVRLLREAQRAYPEDFWLNFYLGLHLADRKDHEGAVRFYTAAVSIRPRATAALNNLGSALHGRGTLDEAVAVYHRALAIDPNDAGVFTNLGSVLRAQNKLGEAIAAYRQAIKLEPTLAAARNNLGNVLRAASSLDEAVVAYREAVELDPKNATYHRNLAVALVDQVKLDDAVAAAGKSVELDPKLAASYTTLAIALSKQGRQEQAIREAHRAIELDPRDALAHNTIGLALLKQDKLDDAAAALREAVKVEPTSALFHTNLGIALFKRGERDAAVDSLRKAAELEPKNPARHAALGTALYQMNEAAEAAAAFRKAVDLDPNNARYRDMLGTSSCAAGDWKGVIRAFENLAEVRNGGASDKCFYLAIAHWQLGDKAEARRWYDHAVESMRRPDAADAEELTRLRGEVAELLGVKDRE